MKILTAQYWPRVYNPKRQGALVSILTKDKEWYTVKGFDGTTWLAIRDELEPLAEMEGDE